MLKIILAVALIYCIGIITTFMLCCKNIYTKLTTIEDILFFMFLSILWIITMPSLLIYTFFKWLYYKMRI